MKKIKNQRKDFQHKWSRRIVNENQIIVSEDLKPSNMIKNHKLAKSIQDASWSSFCNMIDYKAKWYGRTYIKVGKFFPSSRTCHCCGYKYNPKDYNDVSWSENIREWVAITVGHILKEMKMLPLTY